MGEAAAVAAHRVVADGTSAGLTVATAESLTAGLVAATVATVPGASAVLRGGLVVYTTALKHDLAGVDADLLAARGPVDPDVAGQLARGAAQRCGADVGVGVTGVAGPDPQDGHPVGEVWIGVWGAGLDAGVPRVTALDDGWRRHVDPAAGHGADGHGSAVRAAVRGYTVLRALDEVDRALQDLPRCGNSVDR